MLDEEPSLTRDRQRDFAPDYSKIPPHGRWQHFEAGGRPRVDQLLASWGSSVDNQERTRRLIDLFLVSVLLDAGAGTRWSYRSKESGKTYRRSEGLAIASLEMFKAGYFSSDDSIPCQVDYVGLKRLTAQQLAQGLQVSETNPIMGLDGRAGLLSRLADALRNKGLFGTDGRPGNMLGNATVDFYCSMGLKLYRLPSFTSIDPGVVRPNSDHSHSLDSPKQRACQYLA